MILDYFYVMILKINFLKKYNCFNRLIILDFFTIYINPLSSF
jgi:hypothetical protein